MAKAVNLIGQRFGKLVVVDRAENNKRGNTMWLCQCDCGNTKIALGYDLTHGRTVSCGCKASGVPSKKRKDLTGQKFGTMTVISLSEERSKNGHLYWNCVCECGQEAVMSGTNLKMRQASHAGCTLTKERPYNYIDISGNKYGRLTVLKEVDSINGRPRWLCKCDCGNDKIVYGAYLKSGQVKSCGCLLDETRHLPKRITHGETNTKLYQKYRGMLGRCSPLYHGAEHYYEKGIRVCDEWTGEHGYEHFKEWSLVNGYDEDKPWTEMTLDRIDNNGNYEPSNCRWTTSKQQCNNMSTNVLFTYMGKTQTMKQWCEELDLSYGMVKARHRKGIEPPELFAPKSV